MESKSKLFGHPLHTMLIVFPLGLLATAAIFAAIYLFSRNGTLAQVACYLIGSGIIGGLIAAPFGWRDWFSIPEGTRAKAVGLWHGLGNTLVLAIFALSWLLWHGSPTNPAGIALVLTFAGAVLALVTGWLGGELVDRLGIGVDTGANVDAPNSLTGRSASDVNAPAPHS